MRQALNDLCFLHFLLMIENTLVLPSNHASVQEDSCGVSTGNRCSIGLIDCDIRMGSQARSWQWLAIGTTLDSTPVSPSSVPMVKWQERHSRSCLQCSGSGTFTGKVLVRGTWFLLALRFTSGTWISAALLTDTTFLPFCISRRPLPNVHS